MVVVERTFREVRLHTKVQACSPLFYKSFQMVSGFVWGFFVVIVLVIVLGVWTWPSASPSSSPFTDRQTSRSLVCVFSLQTAHLSPLVAALHQSYTDLHGERFQEILVKGRYDFRNQPLWSFILILFAFPLLFWSCLLNMCF